MSFGKIIGQTAVMIVTGKLVNEGYEGVKKRYAKFKEQRAATGKKDPKQVGTIHQVDAESEPEPDAE